MSKSFFSDKHFQKWLFLLAGGAFGLSLLKNVFLEQHPGILFYMLELISFILFLLAFYLSDRNNQILHDRLTEAALQKEQDVQRLKERISELESTVNRFEAIQNETTRFASYQEKVVRKLLDNKRAREDKHHLLFLLTELFHGMAAVLYKKEELTDQFAVEASYGLPEDYSPASFQMGEGLHGQSVADGQATQVEELPEDYLEVESGLGKTGKYFLYMLPVIKEDQCYALIEIMTFRETEIQRLWPDVMEKLVKHEVL